MHIENSKNVKINLNVVLLQYLHAELQQYFVLDVDAAAAAAATQCQ